MASLIGDFNQQHFTDPGFPASGYRLYTWIPNTTTLKIAYMDTAGAVPHVYTPDAFGGQYIALNARGELEAPLMGSGTYDIALKRSDGSDVWTRRASAADSLPTALDAALRADLAATTGENLLGTQQPGGRQRTQGQRNADVKYVTDFSTIVADGTDQTAAMVAWLSGLGAAAVGYYIIPYNTKFTPRTVITAIPAGVVLEDESGINGYQSAGETSKMFGLLSSDVSVSDTHRYIRSGHHATLNMVNDRSAGSVSADEGKVSLAWSIGDFALGPLNKRGYRLASLFQWTKVTGTNYWARVMRSLAYWLALAAAYEMFIVDEAITAAGVYRNTGENIYVSTGGGSAGTMPVHTTGIVGIWTWFCSADETLESFDQYGRVLWGGGSDGPTFRHKASRNDPNGGTYIGQFESTGVSKQVIWRGTPTNSLGAPSLQPYYQWENGLGMRFMKSDGSTDLGSVTDAGWRVAIEGTTTPAPTVASASVITITSRITFVSGTNPIDTIVVPPIFAASGGQITLIPTGAWTMTTASNLFGAVTAAVGRALIMTYDSATNKYYPSYT